MQLLSPATRKLFDKATLWFNGLQPRERWMVIGLAVVLVLMGGQATIAAFQNHKTGLRDELATAQEDILWLGIQQRQMVRLQQQGAVNLDQHELEETIRSVADQVGVEVAQASNQESGTPNVRMNWQGADFSLFMTYLSVLARKGVDIRQLEVSRDAGLVSAMAEVEG